VLALTATASEPVREEIIERLRMRSPEVIVHDMDRPNVFLGVKSCQSDEVRKGTLLNHVEEADKPGIIYVATRRHAEEIADALSERGIKADFYHGHMSKKERDAVQADFMEDRTPVIVATSAFGMGVDKPNVRLVFHYCANNSLNAYYQELGRSGRDGAQAQAWLFYRPQDLNLHKFFAAGGQLDAEDLEEAAELVHEEGVLDQDALQDRVGLPRTKLSKAGSARLAPSSPRQSLTWRVRGVIQSSGSGEVSALEGVRDLRGAAHAAAKDQERHRQYLLRKLEQMRMYAEIRDCRRQYLLDYFGKETKPCGFCDNCERGLPEQARAKEDQPFPTRTRIVHKKWGKGVVTRDDGNSITVLFDEPGEKVLAVDFAMEHELLARAP
jgi:ATP-dependent DNA helicase RecQ